MQQKVSREKQQKRGDGGDGGDECVSWYGWNLGCTAVMLTISNNRYYDSQVG